MNIFDRISEALERLLDHESARDGGFDTDIPDVPDGAHVDDGRRVGVPACGAELEAGDVTVFKDYEKACIARDKVFLRELGIGSPCEACLRALEARKN